MLLQEAKRRCSKRFRPSSPLHVTGKILRTNGQVQSDQTEESTDSSSAVTKKQEINFISNEPLPLDSAYQGGVTPVPGDCHRGTSRRRSLLLTFARACYRLAGSKKEAEAMWELSRPRSSKSTTPDALTGTNTPCISSTGQSRPLTPVVRPPVAEKNFAHSSETMQSSVKPVYDTEKHDNKACYKEFSLLNSIRQTIASVISTYNKPSSMKAMRSRDQSFKTTVEQKCARSQCEISHIILPVRKDDAKDETPIMAWGVDLRKYERVFVNSYRAAVATIRNDILSVSAKKSLITSNDAEKTIKTNCFYTPMQDNDLSKLFKEIAEVVAKYAPAEAKEAPAAKEAAPAKAVVAKRKTPVVPRASVKERFMARFAEPKKDPAAYTIVEVALRHQRCANYKDARDVLALGFGIKRHLFSGVTLLEGNTRLVALASFECVDDIIPSKQVSDIGEFRAWSPQDFLERARLGITVCLKVGVTTSANKAISTAAANLERLLSSGEPAGRGLEAFLWRPLLQGGIRETLFPTSK